MFEHLITKLQYIREYELYGGNDPEDKGCVKSAVDSIITVLIELIANIKEAR